MSDVEELSPNLYVVGLPLDFTNDDLYELFSSHGHGNPEDCKCLPAKEGKTTKAGFVNFGCVEHSKNAFDYFSIKENNPLQLVIGYSRKKRVNAATVRMADTNTAHGKVSLNRKPFVSRSASTEQPTRSESPLIDDRKPSVSRSSMEQATRSESPLFHGRKPFVSRCAMEQPTRTEYPLFDDNEEKFQRSSEDSCRGFKEYPNSQQPIISFPDTPISRTLSFTSDTGMSHFDHLPKNIHNFQSGREKSIESRGRDIVISVRNVKNDVMPSVQMKIICVICGSSAFFCCGRCKSLYYCGEQCQIMDWVENDHRADCFKYEHSSPFQNFSETASISSMDAANKNYMASIEGASAIGRNSSPRPSRIIHKDIPSIPLRKPRILDSVASHGEPKASHSLKSITSPMIPGGHVQKTKEITTTLPRQSLREEEKVFACYGSNPYKFYVQKISDIEDLTHISITLNSHSLENCSTVRVNSFCAAKYTDGEWYRVRIDKVSDDGLNVEAFFLDFGNTDIVPISNLSEIPKDLLNFSPKAYCVRLLKVKPLNHAKDFSSESLEKISELLKVPYTVKKSIFTIEGIFTVELEDDNGNNLSTLLLEKKIADPVSIYLIKSEKSVSKDGNSEASSKAKPYLIKLDPQYLNYLDEVILCYGNDPLNFYVHKVSDFKELVMISDELTKQSSEPSSVGEFRVGSICAAKYNDGLWYRAEIIVKNSIGKCRVNFVDFGNDEVVSTSDLKPISSTLSFSPKAFRCSLYKSNCHEFTESVKDELQNSGATVKEVRKKGQTYEVELISKISMEDISTLLNKSPNPVNTGHPRASLKDENSATEVLDEVQSIVEVPQQMVSVLLESKADLNDIPKKKLVPGDKVLLCHGSNPRSFFVNKMSEYEELAFLTEQLQTSSLSSKPSISPQIGLICCVLSGDGLWYRSRIQKILDDGKVQAFFVDFGNEITVDASSLRPLPKTLFAYSPKAYCLQLKVKPLNGEAEFSSEVEKFFQSLINDSTLTVVKSSHTENGFEVELKDEEQNDLAALLTTCQFVELICNDTKKPANSGDVSKPIKETNTPLTVPSTSESLSEQKEEKLTPQAVLHPKISSLPEQNLVLGDRVTLLYGKNPSNFYVQKLSEDAEIKIISESLQTILSVKKVILTEPREGLMCCSIFEDNLWYRARIQKILDNGKAKIFFVDFGNEEVVSVSELLELPEDLLKYPAKAFCLKLKVKPLNNSEDFTAEVQESFHEFINGYPLIVKECVQNESIFIVDLKDEEENDIGNLLVTAGLADLLSDYTPVSKPSTKEAEVIAQTVINPVDALPSTALLPAIKNLPQQTLASGDKVILVYGRDPSSFFANKVSEGDEMLKISELLQSQKSANEGNFSPQVGLLCSALFEDDNLWYRGKLQKVLEDGKVEVLFVDYGNKAVCSASLLRELPKELLSYSAKAYSLKLKVKPLNGASQFPDEVQETFSSFIEGYTLIVKECVQSGSSFIVDLKDEKDNDIAGALISSKLAVPFNDNTPSAKNHVTSTNIKSSGEVRNPVITPEKQKQSDEPEKLATTPSFDSTLTVVKSSQTENGFEVELKDEEQNYLAETNTLLTVPSTSESLSEQREEKLTPQAVLHPKISSLPEQNLVLGDRVTLLYGRNPSNFYVQKLSEDAEIKIISESLQTILSVKKVILSEPREGLMCCSIFEDNLWYRARIQKILDNGKAKILFVDFGNEEVVSVSELLELPEDLLKYPAKAFCLKLKVKPLNNIEDFTTEVQESFHEFINGYPLIVKECVQNESVFIVDLKDEEENDIGSLLVTAGLADLLSDYTPVSKPSTKEAEVIAQTVINPAHALPSTALLPEIPNLPQQTLASGDKVILVYGRDPSNFYANKVSEGDEMLKISELLQSQKSANEGNFSPQVGLLCSALFEDDNLWYRGKVQKVLEDGKVEVLFVDYGNKAVCSASLLSELPKELLSYSAKAYSLNLKVKPLNGASQFPDEVQETFSSFIEGYTLIVKECVQSGSSFIVDLKDEKDNDIAGALISSKLAVPFNENTPSAKNHVTSTNIKSSVEVAEVRNPVITPEKPKQSDEPEKLATAPSFYNALDCDLPQQCLSTGDKVALVFENDPLGFYVNKFSDFDDIKTISKRLESQSSAKHDPFIPKEGMFCCAQFKEDGLWYRARILNILGDGTAKVSFLDYGNEEVVELVALHALPKDLLEFCAKAFCLKLRVKPLNGTKFSTDIRESFNDLIKGYPLIVKEAKKNGLKYIVSLKDEESNDIADLLVNNKLALPVDDAPVTDEPQAAPLKDNTQPPVKDNTQPPVKDNTQPPVFCTKKNVVSELPKQTLISGDKVIIVYGSGPTKFYAHKYSDTNEICVITKVLEDQMSLNKQTLSLTPQVGLLCSALYEDGVLYRAQITEILHNGKVKLFFIDYGNEEISDASSLRELPKELLAYSAKAYCIYLKSSNPLDFQKELPTEVQKAFEIYMNIQECSPCDTGFIVKLEGVEISSERDVSQSTSEKSVTKEDSISQALPQLPQQQLISGDEIGTSHFESPLCFYVSKITDTVEISKISEYLKKQPPSTKSSNFVPTQGVLCIAKYSDGDWYRARVNKILNTETVEVYFVDYGNTEVLNFNSIAALPEEMWKYSPKVFQVRLSKIQPSNSSKDFSTEANARCFTLLQEIPLTLTSVVKNGFFFDIRVINQAKKDIADILVEEKFAEAIGAESLSHSSSVKVDPQSAAQPSQIANDIEPKTNDQTSNKTSSVPKMSFMEGRPMSLPLEKLRTGVDYEVVVSWVMGPYIYVQMQSKFAELQKLELNLGYGSSLRKDNEHLPEVGDYISSKFIDEKWYRSRVTSIASPDSVEVFFLDFGNSNKVTRKDVLPLPKPAFKIPALAHCVCIEGVQEINEEFAGLLINEKWTMRVSSLNPEHLGDVEAIVTFKSDSEITNKMLRCQIHPYSSSSLQSRKPQTSLKINASIATRSFKKGDQVSLEVLDISDVNALTCRILDDKDGKSFEGLMEEIQTHCSRTSQSLNYKPGINDFVLAKNTDDGKWYRANVVMPVTGKKVGVSYVDLLDIAMIPITDVLPMVEKLASIPSLGLVCSVYGINEENWEGIHGQLKAFLKVRNNIIKAEVHLFGGANGTCSINIKEFKV